MFEIRYGCNPEDLPRLYEIEKICFPPSFRWSKPDFVEALKKDDIWVAWDEEKIVGFFIGEMLKKETVGHVITIDVDPEFRRRGIGEALLNAAETHYYKEGIRRMELEVHVDNPAQVLYFKTGYRVFGVKKGYYANGSMGISMAKTLKRKINE